MTARHHTCITIACNVCGELLDGEERTHYASITEAATFARDCAPGWVIQSDGYAVCDDRDAEHQAAMDALLPPAPEDVIDGQTEIDVTGGAR